MTKNSRTYDVFLSFALADAGTAGLVSRALSEAGLDVFTPEEIEPASKLSEAVWQALAESSALVAVINPDRPPAASLAVELGAAMAWHKPIYVVHSEPANTRFPSYLSDFPAYPVSRIEDVVQSIARQTVPLSTTELKQLRDIYARTATPTDQLLRRPAAAEQLARSFEKASGRKVSAEQLVHELVRLRKKGELPRLKNPGARKKFRSPKKAVHR